MKTNKAVEEKREAFENMAEAIFEKHQQKIKNTYTKKILDKATASQTITLKRLQKILLEIKRIKINK